MRGKNGQTPIIQVEPTSPIAQEYYILTQNNYCAAFLLHTFHNQQAEHTSDVLTCTLQQLQMALGYSFPPTEICRALDLLLKETFVYLKPDPLWEKRHRESSKLTCLTISTRLHFVYTQPNIPVTPRQPFIILIDRRKISFLLETCAILSSPARLLTENKALQKKYKSQKSLVDYQCSRALKQQLPATLSLFHWMQTYNYFDGKCAYCGEKPGHVIEHYIPIGHGSGTQWSNCVPACRTCNGKKGEKHPDQVMTMPSLSSVGVYLAMLKHIEETLLTQANMLDFQRKREDHQRLDPMNRALVSSVRFDRRIGRFFFSLQMIRLTGWISGAFLLVVIPAPWWLASSFYQTHHWDIIF